MKAVALVLLPLFSLPVAGQEVDTMMVSLPLRGMLEHPAEPEETARWAEYVVWRMEHPLDLRTATDEELLFLPGVSSDDVRRVRTLRSDREPASPHPDSAHMADEVPAMLAPFVQLKPRSLSTASFRAWRTWRQSGGEHSLKSGSRLTVRPLEHLLAEIQWEERRDMKPPASGVRGGVLYERPGILRTVVAGDFQMCAAEGVVFGSSFGSYPGVTDELLRPRPPLAISLSTSGVVVPRFFSGVAVATRFGVDSISIALAYSTSHRSGIRSGAEIPRPGEEVPVMTGEFASPLIRDGQERAWGARVSWSPAEALRLGCSGMVIGLSTIGRPAETSQKSETSIRIVGVDATYRRDGSMLCLEAAGHSSGAFGVSGRVVVTGRGATQLGIGGRWFEPGFWNPHAAGVSTDGDTRGERSGWAGARVVPFPWLVTSGALVFARKTTYETGFPIRLSSSRIVCGVQARLRSGLRATLGITFGSKEVLCGVLDSLGRSSRALEEQSWCRLRLALLFRTSANISGEFRSEGSWLTETGRPSQPGLLMGAAVEWRPFRWLSLAMRFVLFDTDTYDSRFTYAEYGPPGRMVLLPLYGAGTRVGAWIRCSPWESVTINCGAAETSLPGGYLSGGRRQVDFFSQLNLRM